MHVDILKVPHHGSSNNLDNDFFERITADHYVMSGDGEHGNPERESIEMLFKARGKAKFELHLTYPIDEIDVLRKEDWEKEQNKEKRRRHAGKQQEEPRPNWSAAKHSLGCILRKESSCQGPEDSHCRRHETACHRSTRSDRFLAVCRERSA